MQALLRARHANIPRVPSGGRRLVPAGEGVPVNQVGLWSRRDALEGDGEADDGKKHDIHCCKIDPCRCLKDRFVGSFYLDRDGDNLGVKSLGLFVFLAKPRDLLSKINGWIGSVINEAVRTYVVRDRVYVRTNLCTYRNVRAELRT